MMLSTSPSSRRPPRPQLTSRCGYSCIPKLQGGLTFKFFSSLAPPCCRWQPVPALVKVCAAILKFPSSILHCCVAGLGSSLFLICPSQLCLYCDTSFLIVSRSASCSLLPTSSITRIFSSSSSVRFGGACKITGGAARESSGSTLQVRVSVGVGMFQSPPT